MLPQVRFYLAAELGDHVELRDEHVVVGVRTVDLLALVDDLYLQLGDLLHAENVIGRCADYHLLAPVGEGLLQGCVVEDEAGEVAGENGLASRDGDVGDRIVELEGVLKDGRFFDFGEGDVDVAASLGLWAEADP